MPQEVIQYLPLDEIYCDRQIREQFAEQPLVGLARSMQEAGLQQPIRVRRDGGRYLTVDGERRLRAARLIKWQTIAAIIEEKELCPGEVTHRQFIANVQRADLSPCERARAIKDLMEQTGWTATEAAAKSGVSSATVTRLLAILELPEAIRSRINAGEIPESGGYALRRIQDPVKQAELADQLAAGHLTRDGLAGEVKAARSGAANSERPGPQKVSARLADGSVTVARPNLTLERFIQAIEEILSKARKARTRGVELAMFCRMLREDCDATSQTQKGATPCGPSENGIVQTSASPS